MVYIIFVYKYVYHMDYGSYTHCVHLCITQFLLEVCSYAALTLKIILMPELCMRRTIHQARHVFSKGMS